MSASWWNADFSYKGAEPPPLSTITNIFNYAGYQTFNSQGGTTYSFMAYPPEQDIQANLVNAISENGMYDDDKGMVTGVTVTPVSG